MTKTIAWLSDSSFLPTGYATMTLHILNGLSKLKNEDGTPKYNCHQLAHNYVGQTQVPGTTFEDGTKVNFTVHGNGLRPYCQDIITHKLKELNADVFVTLLDTFMVAPFFPTYDFGKAKTIFYYPSDGGSGLPQGCDTTLKKMDKSISMSRYGKEQIESMHNIPSGYIPHGIDINTIYPLTKKQRVEIKTRMGIQDKFVVGTVARNQGRKMLDRTIKAFALFAKDRDDVVLVMHCDPHDPASVSSLPLLITRYGIQNKVLFTGMRYFRGFTYKQMNKVFNCMDLFILTTSGEGFGMPILEAMACSIPALVTNYTTTQELVLDNDAGLGINLLGTEEDENPKVHENEIVNGTITGGYAVERGICCLKDAAKKMKFFYDNRDEGIRMGKNGRKAVIEQYDWNLIIDKWDKVMEELTRL